MCYVCVRATGGKVRATGGKDGGRDRGVQRCFGEDDGIGGAVSEVVLCGRLQCTCRNSGTR